LKGNWTEKNWLNVPGPFYGAMTDTCQAGPVQAPGNVLFDENFQEFVWRQPRNENEVRDVLNAAYQDPFDGYGWDGDAHWTAAAVFEWWNRRDDVSTWLDQALRDKAFAKGAESESRKAVLAGLRAFRDYLEGALGHDLETYAAWLDAGHAR
jgi:hypothetical protein